MAFSFIFAGAPGSVSNADRLMSIHNRQSVRQFCNDIRWRAAGGKEAVDKRLAQVAALEKEGNALIASNDFTAAYSKFEEASLLIGGDFTASLLTSTIKALMGLQKYEEAAGLAYHGVYVFDEKAPFYTLHDEIYRCMGYRDTSVWELLFDELPQKIRTKLNEGSNGKPLSEEDFSANLDRLFGALSPIDWNKNLFVVTHALHHLTVNRQFTPRVNLLVKLESSPVIMQLFDRAAYCKTTWAELRFLSWLMRFMQTFHFSRDPSAPRQYLQRPWYNKFIGQLAASFVTKDALEKIALTEVGASFDILFGTWILFMQPLLMVADQGSVKLPTPLDDFEFYCNAASLIFFRDRPLLGRDHDAMFDVSLAMIRLATGLTSNRAYDDKFQAMTEEKFTKCVDVLAAVLAVNFAEFRTPLIRGKLAEDGLKLKPYTSMKLLCHLHDRSLVLLLTGYALKRNRKQVPIKQAPFLAHFTKRVDFLLKNMSRKFTSDGEKELSASVSLLVCGSCADGGKDYAKLAEYRDFCLTFGSSVLRNWAYLAKTYFRSEEMSKLAVELVARLAVPHLKSPFAKELYSESGDPFCVYIMEGFVASNPSISCATMSEIIRGADLDTRKRWRDVYRPQATKLANFLFDVILSYPPQVVIDEWISMIYAFHALVNEKPEIVSLDLVIKTASKRYPDPIAVLLQRMSRFIERPTYASGFVKWRNHAENNPALTPCFLHMMAVIAGMVVASVAQKNTKMKSALMADDATRRKFITEMKKLVPVI